MLRSKTTQFQISQNVKFSLQNYIFAISTEQKNQRIQFFLHNHFLVMLNLSFCRQLNK
jgi:hypothetical protein